MSVAKKLSVNDVGTGRDCIKRLASVIFAFNCAKLIVLKLLGAITGVGDGITGRSTGIGFVMVVIIGFGVETSVGVGLGRMFVTTTVFGAGVGEGVGLLPATTRGRIGAGVGSLVCGKTIKTEDKKIIKPKRLFIFLWAILI